MLCAISIPRPLLDLFWTWPFFLQRYPKMLLSKISLLSMTGENDGGDRGNWRLCQVYQFSFPAPSPTLALTLVIWGTGEFVALSVSCVMEWNISLAIFLATKCVLCLEAIFSVFCPLSKLLDGGRPFSFLIRSTGPRPLVLNRAGLASAAAIESDCWAGDLLGGNGICRPRLNRAGLHLFGVMCCYRAEELWHVSHLVSRRVKWQICSISKGRCN